MNCHALFPLLLLALPINAKGAEPSTEFTLKVTGAKDVASLAMLLQEQMNRPPGLMLQVTDFATLAKAQNELTDALAQIKAIHSRLKEFPVPAASERETLSKRIKDANAALVKERQPALQAHMAAMPELLRTATVQELQVFYKEAEGYKKVFESYFQPDTKASADGVDPATGTAKPESNAKKPPQPAPKAGAEKPGKTTP